VLSLRSERTIDLAKPLSGTPHDFLGARGIIREKYPIGCSKHQVQQGRDGKPTGFLSRSMTANTVGNHHPVTIVLKAGRHLFRWEIGRPWFKVSAKVHNEKVVLVIWAHFARMRHARNVDFHKRREWLLQQGPLR
jgi:hypothetical protein